MGVERDQYQNFRSLPQSGPKRIGRNGFKPPPTFSILSTKATAGDSTSLPRGLNARRDRATTSGLQVPAK